MDEMKSPTGLRIDPLTMSDYDEVFRLWKSCEGIGLSDADSFDSIRLYLERNPGMSHVARTGGRVVGAVLSGHDGRRGFLHHLAVHPKCRKRGVGRLLAGRCLEALRAAGIQKCHLMIYASNESGIAFWERIGWTFREDIGLMSITLDP